MNVKTGLDEDTEVILVVEDSRTQAEQLKYLLEQQRYRVMTAENGKQALALLRECRPMLVITDIIMPKMDGYDLCKRIKSDEKTQEIPVILLTSLTSSEDVLEGLACGADNFITKPYSEKYLLSSIEKILVGRKLRKSERVRIGVEIVFGGKSRFITADQQQMLSLLISTYEAAVHRNTELVQAQDELRALNERLEDLVEKRTAALSAEIVERKRAEENLRRQTAVTAAINRVLQGALQAKTDVEEALICLSEAEDLTGSKFGWIGEVNPSGRLDTIALTDPGWDACRIRGAQPPMIRDMEIRGIFGRVLKDGKSLITNEPGAHPDRVGLPSGHMELTAFLGVPLKQDGRTVGMIALGNKPSGYAMHDQEAIEALSVAFVAALQRQRTEEALRESEELFRTVVESTTDAIVILDMNRIIVSCNKGFCKLFGYTVDEVRRTSVQMLHRAEEAYHRFGEIAYASIQKTGSYRGEVYFTKKDGTVFPGETVTSAMEKSGSVAGYVGIIRDITDRKQDEAERELLMAAIGQVGESVFITDPAGTIQYVNPTFERVTGYLREEAVGNNTRILKSGKQDEGFYRDLWETISGGKTWKGRMVNKRKDGKLYTEEATISPVCDASGRILNYVAVKRDITEQLQLAAQFLQAQKLEAVGRLTGGVAHDFNNLLTTIIGNAEMVIAEVGKESPLYGYIEDIKGAGERAAQLTRQLLAFSRKQVLQPEVVNLNEVVAGVDKMLRRVIGEDIELENALASDLGRVEADIGQLEQVIMNLAVNAKDAMPGGGNLIIETANVDLNETYAKNHVAVTPGPYVMLCVSDTGVGMSPEVQAQAFEPFFTTKEKSKGTGLGLSTVYGIVKQSRGNIWVYSEVGRGTSFKIYLPRVDKAVSGENVEGVRSEARGGTETVLVVEDEEQVRNLAEKVLEGYGYQVLAAKDGREALELLREHEGPIHLMLTDVVMPGMSGRELAERLKGTRPEMKVIYMSGYTDNAIVHHGILDNGIAFIQKPFKPRDLARKLRVVLEA